jgi:CubicO group peptidase (beta-lactamase class C family)
MAMAITRIPGFAGGIVRAITAVMIGMLVSDGRCASNETAPVPAWQRPGDPRGEITLRHLLQMRSGLREEPGDDARMLFGSGATTWPRCRGPAAGRRTGRALERRRFDQVAGGDAGGA